MNDAAIRVEDLGKRFGGIVAVDGVNLEVPAGAVDGVRALLNGGPTAGKVFTSLTWSLAIVAVFAPLAVRRYRRTS